MPSALLDVWFWFQQLSRTRSSNGFGQDAISYAEVLAWSKLTGTQPDPLEIQALMAIDSVYIAMQVEAIKKRSKSRG